ncbi:unnamed protein product [Caenorhabditis auriculariae]|uniref:Uncharacterized protein n=1 Tax=Caenorhabditis auriculariae TaxID=2777116 RepID=A0A8S1H149_9PELO|nr:unnamed protein product [Caenorhabditis auriculariae]
MNELMAIIVIVILCCLMFFLWLVSMATCPDTMVNFLSGKAESGYTSHDSKELIARCEEENISHEFLKSIARDNIQLNSGRRTSDKKLSVVPEADEQSTVQSTIHSIRPSILRAAPVITAVVHEEDKDIIELS